MSKTAEASGRVTHLLKLYSLTCNHPRLSQHYGQLIQTELAKDDKALPQRMARQMCPRCGAYLIAGASASMCVQKGHVVATCTVCGQQGMRLITSKKQISRSLKGKQAKGTGPQKSDRTGGAAAPATSLYSMDTFRSNTVAQGSEGSKGSKGSKGTGVSGSSGVSSSDKGKGKGTSKALQSGSAAKDKSKATNTGSAGNPKKKAKPKAKPKGKGKGKGKRGGAPELSLSDFLSGL
ncbi:RNAse P, Rpr2/Rpp21 subunit [Kipferlia bialata]|uniref:RNAse P, Rpr2/Rpp21 subunit n=1 Tax=Kipferlia bialata TaxID=797122 RepID=A0A9K3CYD8_9EUKA|nr:RNAse P, Rpr2/Rpp21 subunit [Kipferlia bialata]|eukprot:g6116.t1